jgi:hypothetical protein
MKNCWLYYGSDFDRDQNVAIINQTIGCSRLFGHLWSIIVAVGDVKYFTATQPVQLKMLLQKTSIS